MIGRVTRFFHIERVIVRYALEDLFLASTPARSLRHLSVVSPTRWMSHGTRTLPRGARLRLALEELGPVFVKLGQMLSTRRDLLPDDIGDELALLQDQVTPFPSHAARHEIELALGESVDTLFARFEDTPIASASVAQVHGVTLHTGERAVIKVLRPGIGDTIDRDVSLMYVFADIATRVLPDGRRLRPREVVAEYDRTIHGELDLVAEASNAVVFKSHFPDSKELYIPGIFWDYTRRSVMVQERIDGIPIRDIAEMRRIGMDMKKLAEHGVEIFYEQVFKHNFFHADMHPGNIFVSRKTPGHPQYIAIDFGIVGTLTDEDQRYIGENLLAFFQRDYRRVAQLHIDSGWVPRDTRVSEFEAGIRAVCEPIFDKPLSEISFGNVLLQLFQVARRFEMEVQPQLVLLQKTLLNIEGLGRQLYPELDVWATGKPYLQAWVLERNNPKRLIRQVIAELPGLLRAAPQMPMLIHDVLALQKGALRRVREVPLPDEATTKAARASALGLRLTIAGAALAVGGALLGAAGRLGEGELGVMAGVGMVTGVVLLVVGLLS